MTKARIAILGAGAWGTAIAIVLAREPSHRVTLWCHRPENARELLARRENVRLLPGVPIPESVLLTTDLQQAIEGADLLVIGVPTVYLRATLTPIAASIPPRTPVLSLAKGIERDTFLRPTQIIEQVWGDRPTAVLSGPSHAEEVACNMPTTVVAASRDPQLASWVQLHFTGGRFRVYTNPDLVGVELAGALKNIIGIAAGISDGLGFGDNAKSALLTRGLAEMTRFGVALGADPRTFAGLAGMGDLITTCLSRHGRNRQVGLRLAQGEKLAGILATMTMVAEGIFTTRSVHEQALRLGISMPIVDEVFQVLFADKDPLIAVQDLMLREPTHETR